MRNFSTLIYAAFILRFEPSLKCNMCARTGFFAITNSATDKGKKSESLGYVSAVYGVIS